MTIQTWLYLHRKNISIAILIIAIGFAQGGFNEQYEDIPTKWIITILLGVAIYIAYNYMDIAPASKGNTVEIDMEPDDEPEDDLFAFSEEKK